MRTVRLCIAACLLLAAGVVFAADQKKMSVTVKETPVRATASFLGKILGTLKYADRVTILEQPAGSKSWVNVRGPDGKLQGWVSLSALQDKTIVLKSGSQNVAQGASTGEVALAGKGFNESVEKEYKAEGNVDYTWVDRMQQIVVSPDQLAAFITQGGLASPEGGAK
jgi:uncharacterized protein YgiM (DUF1202 family)